MNAKLSLLIGTLTTTLSVGVWAKAEVTQLKVSGTALTGTFVCANDPAGTTTRVVLQSFSGTQKSAGPPVSAPFAFVSLTRTDGTNTLLEASGFSPDPFEAPEFPAIVPQIASSLSDGSVSGVLLLTEFAPEIAFPTTAISFSFAATSDRARDGFFNTNEKSGGMHTVGHFSSVIRAAIATGSITMTLPFTNEIILSCPLVAIDEPELPTTIQEVKFGFITITMD